MSPKASIITWIFAAIVALAIGMVSGIHGIDFHPMGNRTSVTVFLGYSLVLTEFIHFKAMTTYRKIEAIAVCVLFVIYAIVDPVKEVSYSNGYVIANAAIVGCIYRISYSWWRNGSWLPGLGWLGCGAAIITLIISNSHAGFCGDGILSYWLY